MKTTVSFPLRLFLVIGAACLLSVGLWIVYTVDPQQEAFLPCLVHALTGGYCPGCGASRALHSLLHGHLYQAVRYNAVFVLLLPCIITYGAAFVRDFLPGKPIRIHQWLPAPLLYGLLAVLLLFGVLRNLPMEPFVWLRPTPLG